MLRPTLLVLQPAVLPPAACVHSRRQKSPQREPQTVRFLEPPRTRLATAASSGLISLPSILNLQGHTRRDLVTSPQPRASHGQAYLYRSPSFLERRAHDP